jgi:phosphoribosylformylglycinamidine cyclo-ligase
LDAVIHSGSWTIPPIFKRLAYGVKTGGSGPLSGGAAEQAGAELLETDAALRRLMFNTYNMGIGFVLALAPADVTKAAAFLEERGFPAWEIGHVEPGHGELRFA